MKKLWYNGLGCSQGGQSDFTIYARDLFEDTSNEMLEARAEKTVVGGKVVYCSD